MLVLLRRRPPKGHKLLVLATCSDEPVVEDLGLGRACSTVQRLPVLREAEELRAVMKEAVRQWAAEGEAGSDTAKEDTAGGAPAVSGAGGAEAEGGAVPAARGAVMAEGEIEAAATELGLADITADAADTAGGQMPSCYMKLGALWYNEASIDMEASEGRRIL